MSVVANDLSLTTRGLVTASRRLISRNEFFAGLYICGCVNGLVGRMIYTANLEGWTGAVLGFDMNVIVLFACYAGISALLCQRGGEIKSTDLVVAVIFLALVSLPIVPLSWAGVAGLSLYILCFATGDYDR